MASGAVGVGFYHADVMGEEVSHCCLVAEE